MDPAAYHVVYVDNRLDDDLDGKHIHKVHLGPHDSTMVNQIDPWELRTSEDYELIMRQDDEVRHNIKSILLTFSGGTSLALGGRGESFTRLAQARWLWSLQTVIN
jgi:hypothetical protein